jgi:integrase
MQTLLESKAGSTPTLPSNCLSEGPAVSTLTFIENFFIPNHVELKTQAGRTHYHAMLKHVLRPETVDRLLLPYKGVSRSKLKSIPEWPYLDETRLCDISPDHVRRLTSLAANHGYSPQTVKHIKNVVSAIISHAKKERILSGDNPIGEVHLPPVRRKTSHPISLIEAKTIFRMMGYPERQIALIILNGCMSVSEVCGLQWSHVNLTLRTIYVEGGIVPARTILIRYRRASKGLMRVTDDRVRTIELQQSLVDLLNALKRQRSENALGDFLFSTPCGSSISPGSILASKLKPIGRRLGIQFSWQTLKEIHDVLLQDLRSRLNSELAAL